MDTMHPSEIKASGIHPLYVSRRIREFASTKNLTCAQGAVLTALAEFRDENGVAWPAVATLARMAFCCERTVQSSLRVLVQKGLLRVVKPATPHEPTHYQVVIPFVAKPAPQGCNPVPQGVQPVHPKEQGEEKEKKCAQTPARRAESMPGTRRERSEANRKNHAHRHDPPRVVRSVPSVPSRPEPSAEEKLMMSTAVKAWRLGGLRGHWTDYLEKPS